MPWNMSSLSEPRTSRTAPTFLPSAVTTGVSQSRPRQLTGSLSVISASYADARVRQKAGQCGRMGDVETDRVLTSPPPTFTADEVAAIAREFFDVVGTAVSAGSERDQAFLIDGDRPTVLKISNAAEDPA